MGEDTERVERGTDRYRLGQLEDRVNGMRTELDDKVSKKAIGWAVTTLAALVVLIGGMVALFSTPAQAEVPDTSNVDQWRQSIEDRLEAVENPIIIPDPPPVIPPTLPPVTPPDPGDAINLVPGQDMILASGTYSTPVNCRGGGQAVICGESDVTIEPVPGALVVIDCSQVAGFDAGTGTLSNFTLRGLEFDCGGTGRAMRASRKGNRINMRIEGNYVHDAVSRSSGAFGEFSSTVDLFIIGNRVERTGVAGENNAHAIYHGGRGVNRNVNISDNTITDHIGGRAIQIFGHQTGEVMTELLIERNIITNAQGNASILVSHSDGDDKDWIKDALINGNQIIDSPGAAVDLKCPGAVVTLIDNRSFNTSGLRIDTDRFPPLQVIDAGGNVWQ